MLAALLEIIAELILQVVVELLFNVGLRSLAGPFQKPVNPILAATGYALFGAICGGLSLLLVEMHLPGTAWRVVNLVITPMLVGLLVAGMGVWRAKRNLPLLRLDRFTYGYLFALSFALVRFVSAQ